MTEFFIKMNGMPSVGQNKGNYEGRFCPQPFEYAEIGQGGETFVCCPLQMPTTVGDAQDGTFMEVWNSEKSQEIRRTILDGSFKYCLEKTCGQLQSGALPRREDVLDPYFKDIIENNRTELPRGPTTIFMNYDRSCNLACPSCRTDLIALKGKEKDAAMDIQGWATAGHLKDAKRLHITGSGDALGSSIFHSFLRGFDAEANPELRISIGTNGLLFTEANWERICKNAIDIVVVSIDAATKETYAINRGGDYALLLNNLHFIGKLRRSGRPSGVRHQLRRADQQLRRDAGLRRAGPSGPRRCRELSAAHQLGRVLQR